LRAVSSARLEQFDRTSGLAHRHMEPLRQCSLAANQHATFDGWKTLTTRPIDQPNNLAA